MKHLEKKNKILVVGLGKRSGLSVCNFLARKGYTVYGSDSKSYDELKDIIQDIDRSVKIFAGNQSPGILNHDFDLIVLSPGVPRKISLIKEAYKRGIPVIAEVELAYRYMKGKLVAITGTDGKSTTTSLAGHIFKGMGFETFTGGNLGTPFISFVEKTGENTIAVLELSSFQLETIDEFKPDVAAILNLTPDHLDRYDGMEEYLKAKIRIAMNQGKDDFYIYNRDNQFLNGSSDKFNGKKLSFSLLDNTADAFFNNGLITIKKNGNTINILDASRMQIMGMHNIENSMAAILIVISILDKLEMEPDYKLIEKSCYSFKGLAHRMEFIGTVKGRKFINDSKATTVGAVEMAIKSIPSGSVLIMGGKTKGDDYSRLVKIIKDKIKHLILIGESADQFKILFNDVPNQITSTIEEAVQQALKKSTEGDTIILSPACASFDMFADFEERGERFKESVLRLKV